MAPAGLDEARLLHARELGGKGAAVDAQVVGQLLAVEDTGDSSMCWHANKNLGEVGVPARG